MSDTNLLYYIKTYGCQMNVHDSQKIGLLLNELGYQATDQMKLADFILFNTCTIREKAQHKAFSDFGRAKQVKQARPNTIVAVCGCVAQQEKERLLTQFKYIDFTFGPDQIVTLPNLMQTAKKGERYCHATLVDTPGDYQFIDQVLPGADTNSAFIAIMKGCNCACSYCIVPSVRGKEVCRAPKDIISEIRQLEQQGVKEVTLLGQTVNSYHAKRSISNDDMSFPGLIRHICDETRIARIRFASPHPKDVSDELIDLFKVQPRLCPHIHLPAQSGSSAVLARMRRGYTRDKFIDICNELRESTPSISITTDLIVGFSGETDAEFDETLSFMNEVKFDSCFAFKYSTRPGTYADRTMTDDISNAIKENRLEELLTLQRQISKEKNMMRIGQLDQALIFGLDSMNQGLLSGRLPDNRIIHIAGSSDNVGQFVNVKITNAHMHSLHGEIVI